MTFAAFVASVLLGVGSLSYAYAGAGFAQIARFLLLFGALWIFAGWRCWTWFSSLGILSLVALAGFGLWVELPPGWMLSGALGGLLAWDLSDFMRRLRFAAGQGTPKQYDELKSLERRHLARLTVIALAGLLLASIAMLVRLEFTFEWVVLLTLVTVLGATQLVAWLRRRG
jgi:hypothetical protein